MTYNVFGSTGTRILAQSINHVSSTPRVTHLSTNRVQHRLTSLIETNALPLHQTTNCRCRFLTAWCAAAAAGIQQQRANRIPCSEHTTPALPPQSQLERTDSMPGWTETPWALDSVTKQHCNNNMWSIMACINFILRVKYDVYTGTTSKRKHTCHFFYDILFLSLIYPQF